MKNYYVVQKETAEGWETLAKFGSLPKAERFAQEYENKYPNKYSRSGPEWLCIELQGKTT